jgi:hypothetical protein
MTSPGFYTRILDQWMDALVDQYRQQPDPPSGNEAEFSELLMENVADAVWEEGDEE